MSNIFVKPVITEKSTKAMDENQFTFLVDQDSNKIEIRNAFQKLYNVVVESVNLVVLKPKKRRRGRIVGESKPRRKAVISVQKGQNVEEIKKLF